MLNIHKPYKYSSTALFGMGILLSNIAYALEPTVVSENFSMPVNGEFTIAASTLLANDRSENGANVLEIEFLDDWVNGYVNYNRATGDIVFTPTADFIGTGSFTYTVFDGEDRGWGFVTIEIGGGETEPVFVDTSPPEEPNEPLEPNEPNEPLEPLVLGESFSMPAGGQLIISGSELLANDEGRNGTGILEVEYIDDWVNGVASYDYDAGEITFTPTLDFIGTGTFTYAVYDGLERNWASVVISVENTDEITEEPEPRPETPIEEITGDIVKNSIRQFTFNHSLWDHASSQHTNTVTGYWIGEFALVSGTDYGWNGQFGQLDYHSLNPGPNLGSDNSSDVFPSENTNFRDIDIDNTVIMPPNFVQGGDQAEVLSEQVTYARRVIDWIIDESNSGGQKSNLPIYIYEHWPEAQNDNLNAIEWQYYHDLTTGDYHQWFLSYQDQLLSVYPNIDIRTIPVGPIIAEILQNSDLQVSQLSFTDLYEDSAPHGKPNIYFLAGLVSYQAMYGQRVNSEYLPPVDSFSGVSASISDEFDAINQFVWERLNYYNNNGVRIWP